MVDDPGLLKGCHVLAAGVVCMTTSCVSAGLALAVGGRILCVRPRCRALLARITEGSASVGELAAPLDMTFAAASKHLRVLQDAGLVSRGRDAQYRPASLDARPLRAAASWIGDYRQFWDASFDALDAHLTSKEQP